MSDAMLAGLKRNFYVGMAWLIAAIVLGGFAPTIDARLFHPPAPRPIILYVHAAVFTAWVGFFVVQTALVGRRNVKLHRTLGCWGVALGSTMPLLGLATAIVLDREGRHDDDTAAFLAISCYDMLAFAVAFALAVRWRKKPELHRRLMFIASCGLTSAAIARLLPADASIVWIYVGVDLLILLGVACDLLVAKRVHLTYRVALPAILCGQALALQLALGRSPAWLAIAHRLIG